VLEEAYAADARLFHPRNFRWPLILRPGFGGPSRTDSEGG
jgi:hypothetical protein